MKLSIRAVIREAVINYDSRSAQLMSIKSILGVSRDRAKDLLYAFLYNAEEEFLLHIALNGRERAVTNGHSSLA